MLGGVAAAWGESPGEEDEGACWRGELEEAGDAGLEAEVVEVDGDVWLFIVC